MSSLYYLRQAFCRIMKISTRKKVADVCSDLYPPECREEVFSETCIHPIESLCVRMGAKPDLCPTRNRMLPQHVVVVNKDAAVALYALDCGRTTLAFDGRRGG